MCLLGGDVLDLVDHGGGPVSDLAAFEVRGAPVVPGRAGDPEAFQEPVDAHAGLAADQLEFYVPNDLVPG